MVKEVAENKEEVIDISEFKSVIKKTINNNKEVFERLAEI
jgi:hypothetical protein